MLKLIFRMWQCKSSQWMWTLLKGAMFCHIAKRTVTTSHTVYVSAAVEMCSLIVCKREATINFCLPFAFSVTFSLSTASPSYVCTLWTLAVANIKGQAQGAAIICPEGRKEVGGLRMHWRGGFGSLKRSLLPHDPICDYDDSLVASLEALVRMEPSQMEYVRRRRCDSAGETPLQRACHCIVSINVLQMGVFWLTESSRV